jgi:hypothetical protein
MRELVWQLEKRLWLGDKWLGGDKTGFGPLGPSSPAAQTRGLGPDPGAGNDPRRGLSLGLWFRSDPKMVGYAMVQRIYLEVRKSDLRRKGFFGKINGGGRNCTDNGLFLLNKKKLKNFLILPLKFKKNVL